MKRFPQCPICKVDFVKINTSNTSFTWFEEICGNKYSCPAEFRQYFASSFEDEDITYIHFYTKKYNYYTYYEGYISIEPGKTYVYYNVFPRGQAIQSPAFQVMDLKVDWNDLDKLNEKFSILDTFR